MIIKTTVLTIILVIIAALILIGLLGFIVGAFLKLAIFILVVLGIIWLVKDMKHKKRRR